jgi:choline dehydrogenase-like flavoprotein
MINPLGYALENYDAMGAWQTQEKGTVDGMAYTADVDAKSTLKAADLTGTVNGGVELSALLADSEDARSCVIQKWFEKALARSPGDEDKCLLTDLQTKLKANDDLKGLVIALASSDAALFIKEPAQ